MIHWPRRDRGELAEPQPIWQRRQTLGEPIQFQTRRLSLRPWHADDGTAFHSIWGDPAVIWWGPKDSLVASEELLAELVRPATTMPSGCGWWAVENDRAEVVGNVMLQPAKSVVGEIEIGWHFARAFQGRGYATEAARATLANGFDRLEVERIIAPIIPTNAASQRVAEKLGMRRGHRIEYAGHPHDVWSIARESCSRLGLDE